MRACLQPKKSLDSTLPELNSYSDSNCIKHRKNTLHFLWSQKITIQDLNAPNTLKLFFLNITYTTLYIYLYNYITLIVPYIFKKVNKITNRDVCMANIFTKLYEHVVCYGNHRTLIRVSFVSYSYFALQQRLRQLISWLYIAKIMADVMQIDILWYLVCMEHGGMILDNIMIMLFL